MAKRHRRFDDTTEHLRDVAARLVVEHGVRFLTLESLSEHGFASVGSVYERWGSREALLDDLVRSRFESAWAALAEEVGYPSGVVNVLTRRPPERRRFARDSFRWGRSRD